MNAKTLEAVRRHGAALLAAFPNCTEKDPIALCKKLRRIETSLTRPLVDYCNGENGVTFESLDAICEKALERLTKLIGVNIAHVNRDPRGYALKLDDAWTREYNAKMRKDGNWTKAIYTDMGGYGIIAPDLTNG